MRNIGANRNASPDKDEEEDDMRRQKVCGLIGFKTCNWHHEKCLHLGEKSFPSILFQENEGLVTLNKDLAALLEVSVKCKKGKPPSTKDTKKEAFDRYMKMIYRLPPRIEVPFFSSLHFTGYQYFMTNFHLIHCDSLKVAPLCIGLKQNISGASH